MGGRSGAGRPPDPQWPGSLRLAAMGGSGGFSRAYGEAKGEGSGLGLGPGTPRLGDRRPMAGGGSQGEAPRAWHGAAVGSGAVAPRGCGRSWGSSSGLSLGCRPCPPTRGAFLGGRGASGTESCYRPPLRPEAEGWEAWEVSGSFSS